jgi:hypothetical protein
MKNLETYDGKHQNPRPIQSVTYLRNYEATDLWKKKWTLLVATGEKLLKLLSQSIRIGNRARGSYCCSIVV